MTKKRYTAGFSDCTQDELNAYQVEYEVQLRRQQFTLKGMERLIEDSDREAMEIGEDPEYGGDRQKVMDEIGDYYEKIARTKEILKEIEFFQVQDESAQGSTKR